jgi:hypothetical protein
MRRVLASLKYVPAALCGLLVVAWMVSLFGHCWFVYVSPYGHHRGDGTLDFYAVEAGFGLGTARAFYGAGEYDKPGLHFRFRFQWEWAGTEWLGRLTQPSDFSFYGGLLPIPLLLTFVLPPSLAPFTRFRFPLWSYFAYTALLAAELAYYLR